MPISSSRVQHVYLLLLVLHTLAASFIWGINTLFLLDAGLSNTEAFASNAFFTAGMVIGLVPRFWVVVMFLVLWALMFAAMTPVRQAYLNGLIESKVRATVLSFDSLLASSGAAVAQPVLGKVADVWSYPAVLRLQRRDTRDRAAVHLAGAPREGRE